MMFSRRTTLGLRQSLVSLNSSTAYRNFRKGSALYSDDEKESNQKRPNPKKGPPTDKTKDQESAAERLNRLLTSMQTDDNLKQSSFANMASTGNFVKSRKEGKKPATNEIFDAAKKVANLIGGDDKKQTESELLAKLLEHDAADVSKTKAKTESSPASSEEVSLSDLIVGMKIDRQQDGREKTRSDFVRKTRTSYTSDNIGDPARKSRKQQKREPETFTGSVNLFGSQTLGIFKKPEELTESPDMLDTWSHLQKYELKLQIARPPQNYFEKVALWTEQGKMWQFPIDNEQGLHQSENDEEDFSEHIFLEQHLESWCPTKGPIRHFMELVCVGLSKNYHLSAKEKKQHILWYKDYFQSKQDILKDLMKQERIASA